MEHTGQDAQWPDGLKPTSTGSPPRLGTENLVVAIRVGSKVPSLNQLFAANPWSRKKIKAEVQRNFGCALSRSGSAFWIPTTSAQSTTLTASGMLECFQMTLRKLSESKPSKGSRRRGKRKGP